MDKLRALGYASLVIGGFLVLTFVVVAYFALWQHEFFLISSPTGERIVATSQQNDSTVFQAIERFNGSRADGQNNTSIGQFGPPGPREGPLIVNLSVDPMSQVISPPGLGILLMGVFFLFNGFVLLDHTQKRDRHETRKFVISSLLTGDEKIFYDELVRTNGEATQKQLSNATGFSAVKTYRVLKRLESKKIVRSFPFGMTKKIMLNEAEK